jgi:hypothetical protein
LSNEASADTRLLIDDYCASHPEFAKTMQAMQPTGLADLTVTAPDGGKEVVGHVKRQLRWRGLLQAFAILFTLSPFSFSFSDGRVTWFMLRDAPATSLAYAVAALAAWIALATFNRRMNRI